MGTHPVHRPALDGVGAQMVAARAPAALQPHAGSGQAVRPAGDACAAAGAHQPLSSGAPLGAVSASSVSPRQGSRCLMPGGSGPVIWAS